MPLAAFGRAGAVTAPPFFWSVLRFAVWTEDGDVEALHPKRSCLLEFPLARIIHAIIVTRCVSEDGVTI
jgi:hypothetical protein